MKRCLLWFVFTMLVFNCIAAEETPTVIHVKPGDSLMSSSQGAPVAPFGETLFYIHSNLGPYPAKTRANALSIKIKDLAQDPFFSSDSMYIMEYEGTYNVVYKDELVTTIVASDSVAENRPKLEIAKERLTRIAKAVQDQRTLTSPENILKSIIFSVLVLLFLVLFVFIVNYLYRFLNQKIDTMQVRMPKALSFLNYEGIDTNKRSLYLKSLNKLLRIILFLMLFLIGLLAMFYILPWTKVFTLQILQFILTPLKKFGVAIWQWMPNFLTIGVIITLTTLLGRLFRFLKREVERGVLKIPGFYPEWALPTYNIIRVIIWIFTLIILWPYIPGSNSKIFQGVSVFLGLVFSLTSASLVSNVMAGFTLTYTRAFRIGDRIKIGEMMGDVIEKSMLVTKIRTIKNEEITIPNSKIMSSEVINYTVEATESGLILNTTITIGYDAPWRKVHELLIQAALSTEGILHYPRPFVFQTSLDDYYISYQINAYTKRPAEMAKIYSELHQSIQDKFNEGGVEIMSPAYRSIRDGNEVTIPEEYRNPEYQKPGFKVDKP